MSSILKGLQLNEVNPHNYDSDWDYQDAVAKSGRSRSSYRSQEDDTFDDDVAYSRKMYQLGQQQKAAREKAQRDSDHDRLASGTNEGFLDAVKDKYNQAKDYFDDSPEAVERKLARLRKSGAEARPGANTAPPAQRQTQADPYQILGVAPNATSADIKLAYRRLAKKHHPDFGGNAAEFQKITDAFNELISSGAVVREQQLDELSNEKLGQYKTAAAADAGKADLAGDYKKADKRFSGIVKATKKQFANDAKQPVKEDINVVYKEAKSLLKQLDENMQQKVINTLKKNVDDETGAFKTGYPRLNNPKILGTNNKAKSIYYPPSKPNVKKLDKPLPESLGDQLKSKSIEALQQVKQKIEQQRMADLEQWEKDFKQNTVAKFTARQPSFMQQQPKQVARPLEKHSVLKARLAQLDKAIEKQAVLDKMLQRLDAKGLLTPAIQSDTDTSMLVRDGANDNYVSLNQKLDKALEFVKNRLMTNKAAFAKPKAIDEAGTGLDIDRSIPGRTIARVSDKANSVSSKTKTLPSYADREDEYDRWSGKTGASTQDDEEDTFDIDYTGDEEGELTEKIKGADGKACWKGKRYAGTKNGKDICIPVKESSILQGLNQLDEGWKEKLGAAALAGSMALGAGAAHSRVTPDGQGGFTGGLKPSATVTAPADNKPAAEAPKGFSKEYLQKAADPNRTGRYMISVEKAQELLKSMP